MILTSTVQTENVTTWMYCVSVGGGGGVEFERGSGGWEMGKKVIGMREREGGREGEKVKGKRGREGGREGEQGRK